PVFVYAAVIFLAGLMVLPPFLGAFATSRRLARPWLLTALMLAGVAVTAGLAYRAPAYTADAPLRRSVRVMQTPDAPATWEVGSTEPGLDLAPDAPAGWVPSSGVAPAGVPWGRLAA